jgi:ketopantoate reductase PanE/ApbA-like protein
LPSEQHAGERAASGRHARAQLGAAGHAVSVLAHDARTNEVASEGLRVRDVLADVAMHSPVAVVDQADNDTFDLVFVALRRDDLKSAAAQLAKLSGRPLDKTHFVSSSHHPVEIVTKEMALESSTTHVVAKAPRAGTRPTKFDARAPDDGSVARI